MKSLIKPQLILIGTVIGMFIGIFVMYLKITLVEFNSLDTYKEQEIINVKEIESKVRKVLWATYKLGYTQGQESEKLPYTLDPKSKFKADSADVMQLINGIHPSSYKDDGQKQQ